MQALHSPLTLRLTWLAARATAPISERLSGWFTARLWFTPWPTDTGEKAERRHQRWLAGSEPLTIPTPYGDLAAFTAGTGPLVLLVHGWGERGATLGALVAPLVNAGYRVVGIDLPAHGETRGTQTDALQLEAAIRATAERLGWVDAVVAHSMGAMNTVLALRNGLQVDAAAFIAPAVSIDRAMETFVPMFGLPPRSYTGLRKNIERRFGSDVSDQIDAVKHARDVTIPTFVAHDADDEQVPVTDGLALAQASGARLVTTTGLGHMRILGDDNVVGKLIGFLDDTVLARRIELPELILEPPLLEEELLG